MKTLLSALLLVLASSANAADLTTRISNRVESNIILAAIAGHLTGNPVDLISCDDKREAGLITEMTCQVIHDKPFIIKLKITYTGIPAVPDLAPANCTTAAWQFPSAKVVQQKTTCHFEETVEITTTITLP